MKFIIFLVFFAIFCYSCQQEESLNISIFEDTVIFSGDNFCCLGGFVREDSSRIIPTNLDEYIDPSEIMIGDSAWIKYYFVRSALACPAFCYSGDTSGFIKLINIEIAGR